MEWLAGIAIVVIAGIAAWWWTSRRDRPAGAAAAPATQAAADASRPRPAVAAFHVQGNRALVSFDVPLPPGDVDEVLANLLTHEAVEIVREKRHTLPIDQVDTVVALGRRGEEFAEAGRITLETPGTLPPPVMPSLMPHASKLAFDPVAALDAESMPHAPSLADRARETDIGPAGGDLQFVGSVDAALRAQGIDPSSADAGTVVLGLMRATGYQVIAGSRPGTHSATQGGVRSHIRVVPHEAGGYPELTSEEVDRFMVEFVSSGADRGLLVTDKYAPFAVYEKEKREPRVRYISRERLQHFVDALTIG